jgi:hypothetical protein
MTVSLATQIAIVTGADALPLPPVLWAYVSHWTAVPPTVDIDLWADSSVTCTGLEVVGAVPKPFALDDDDVDAVVHASNTLTITGHAYATGDGPVRLTTADTLPSGLAEDTDYWIGVVDANTVRLYASLEAVLSQADPVAFSDAGTGTHTIEDTAGTQRLRWLSHGLLGHQHDGAVELDESRGYAQRLSHRPRTLAYALVGTVSGEVSASMYLTRPVKV